MKIKYSTDGGVTYHNAPEGVRIVYEGVPVPGENGTGELHINASTESVITDVWSTRDESLDHNIGTECKGIDDIVSRLVEDND